MIIALVFAVLPKLATAADRDICVERDGGRSIEACSRIIASSQLAGKDLATIYVLRASIYRAGKDYPHAIEDITHAIELLKTTASNDVVASAYATRASIYSLDGDSVKALADYQQTLSLDATNAQAAEGVRSLQALLASLPPNTLGSHSAQQLVAPNEPLPSEIPIPQDVLQLVQTHPFFANAPPVRVGGYSYDQLMSATINGFHGGTSSTFDDSVKWLRQGIVSEQSIMQAKTTYNVTTTSKYKTNSISAADGLVGLGYKSYYTNYIPGIKPMSGVAANLLEHITNLQGVIFPIRVGNRFSYEATYRTTMPSLPDDEMTQSELCEFSQQYEARSFHPNLTGAAYLETCQNQTSYRHNKAADAITQTRTLFFDQLGFPISVDPQLPSQHIIQTYFKDETTQTARLQSFLMAR